MLPDELIAEGADAYQRKVAEIIQAARVTGAFPGEAGKRRIITAYLNQNFYGHDAYGIASAASTYFGVTDLSKLTPAQAALLAGLPKSPSTLDPYLYATRDKKGRLIVDPTSPPILRRDYILGTLTDGRWTHLTPSEIAAARAEPVVLVGDRPIIYRAPHFMWQVRDELVKHFGSLEAVETGGYRVITTLDWKAQQLAEKYITVAAVLPHVSKARAARLVKSLHVSARDRAWSRRLSGRGPRNGAMVAMDYRTGDVLAYVGSAGYYRDDMRSRRFEPKFDVLSQGYRQPGSAFKPIVYATAFDRHVLTPGSLLLDVTTRFARGWAPHDADRRERGPVLVREALQWSLNIPAIRALDRVGSKAVAAQAAKFGITFAGGSKFFVGAGLSAAIGTVEVRPLDLTSAYGALANNGKLAPPRYVLSVDGPDGQPVWNAGKAKAEEVIDPRAAYQVTEIIAGNTDPKQNPVWAKILRLGNGPGGSRRPAAAKTGTTNETLDYATYGFLAPPKDPKAPGIVVGVWMGNSDHSESRGPGREIISLDGPARVWQAFMRDYTKSMPVARIRATRRPGASQDRRLDGGSAGPVHAADHDRALHQGHAAGPQEGRRPDGPDVRALVRRLADRPDESRARACLARRRARLDGASTVRRWALRALPHGHRLSAGPRQLGRPDGRDLRPAALPGGTGWAGQRQRRWQRPVEGLHAAAAVTRADAGPEPARHGASPAPADQARRATWPRAATSPAGPAAASPDRGLSARAEPRVSRRATDKGRRRARCRLRDLAIARRGSRQRRAPPVGVRLRKRPRPAVPFHSPSSTTTSPRDSTTSEPPVTSRPS